MTAAPLLQLGVNNSYSSLIRAQRSSLPGHLDSPFFLRSGFPFLTDAMTMSPGAAAGSLLSLLPQRTVAMRYRFLAPVLSAQLMVAATGRPSDIRNLLPDTLTRIFLVAILLPPCEESPTRVNRQLGATSLRIKEIELQIYLSC